MQQDRHVDRLVAAHARAGGPYRWGVIELEINRDLAALGKFAVKKLAGILPDGLPFSIPGDLPPPIDVPADARDALVQLTIPAHQPGALEYREREDAGAAAVRLVVDEEEVIDNFAEERTSEPLEIARPNLGFGITSDQTYGRILLGLARIRDTNGGTLIFDDRYIPPALDIRASMRLSGFLSDVIARAGQRIEELALRAVGCARRSSRWWR